jgi:shikimate dehydrogenase
MVIIQALASRNILLGLENDPEEEERVIKQVKRRILESQLNVVAVGLPGSGKTTIMRRYAYELGLKFIDIDEETEKLMGQKISDVLSGSGIGEEYFRAMEHEAVRNIAGMRGSVIATGGGTLLNPINRDLLKANGIVVYVKRPLDMLDIKGRPMSLNIGLNELFGERDRIYRRASDMTLINSRVFGEMRAKTGVGNSYNYELKGYVYFIARRVQKYLNELAANKWT